MELCFEVLAAVRAILSMRTQEPPVFDHLFLSDRQPSSPSLVTPAKHAGNCRNKLSDIHPRIHVNAIGGMRANLEEIKHVLGVLWPASGASQFFSGDRIPFPRLSGPYIPECPPRFGNMLPLLPWHPTSEDTIANFPNLYGEEFAELH